MRSHVITVWFLVLFVLASASVMADETSDAIKRYNGIAQNTLAVSIFKIGYAAYTEDCGSSQPGNQQILESWKARNEEVHRNILLAKELAYSSLVKKVGRTKAEEVEVRFMEQVRKAEELMDESSLRDNKNGRYDCERDLKKIDSGYLDIESMFPGISKALAAFIEREQASASTETPPNQ